MTKGPHQPRLPLVGVALACVGYAALTACSSADNELARFIEDTKKEPGGRVEPLPEIKPYETFLYSAAQLRWTLLPSSPGFGVGYGGIRPHAKRKREFLEQFSLDMLWIVGTLSLGSQIFGL